MTYQEIKDRLTKCELTLEKIKDGSYSGKDIKEKTAKLELLKESYQKLLKEAQEKTYLVTPKSGKTKALSLGDDEVDALEDADDIDAIKSADGEDIKEMKPGDEESQEHERMKRLSPKDQETINKIRAMMQAEKDAKNEEEGDYIAGYDDGEGPAADAGEGDERDHMGENEAEDTEGGDLDVGHQDDEPDMLKQYAYDIATYAAKLYKQLDKYDKMDGEVDFPNWWQSKVILAKDYISKAQHYLEFEEKQPAIDQLALEGKVNERLRFLSPEKQKANDAKFEKRMALLKALEKGIELHKAGKISDEELHNLKLKAGTISADDTFGKREDEMNEGQAQIKKKLDKINQALQQHKDKTIAISKTPADQRSEEDKAHLAKMVDLTKMKKQLMAQYDDAVSGMGSGQELDTTVNEYRGVEDDIIEVIKQMALNSDGDEIEAAMEIMEFIGEHYKIDFEFGRAGGGNYGRRDGAPYEDVNEAKGGKFVVRPCSAKNTPWAVWQTSPDGENDKRIKGFKTKPEAQKFADEKNAAK